MSEVMNPMKVLTRQTSHRNWRVITIKFLQITAAFLSQRMEGTKGTRCLPNLLFRSRAVGMMLKALKVS